MARGGRRGNPYRDASGRFASASAGRSGLGASRSKSSPAAARKAARSQSGRASTLAARSSLKRSRSKLASRDPADQRLSSALSGRAQKAAVTRGNRKLTEAKGAAKTKLQGATTTSTIGKNRPKPVTATARPINQSARIPAAQRPGSMTNILGGTLKALAQADAQRIREIESITGQKVRAPRKPPAGAGATVRPPGRRSVSGTLGDNLRQLAQSDARMMRGMAEIARDATPKIGGGRKKSIKEASKALPQGGGAEKPKPSSRTKGSRTRLPGMAGVIGKPKGLKPGALAERRQAKAVNTLKRTAEEQARRDLIARGLRKLPKEKRSRAIAMRREMEGRAVAPGQPKPQMTQKERWLNRANVYERAAQRNMERIAQIERKHAPYRGDIAFNTQPGRIPLRERMNREQDRAFELRKKATAQLQRAQELRQLATTNKGDAERKRQAQRDAVTVEKGSRISTVMYGPGRVVRVNKKTISYYSEQTGSVINVDKSWVKTN